MTTPLSPSPRHPSGNALGWLLLIAASIIVVLFLLPLIFHHGHRHEGRSEAMNNLKQISVMLAEFDSEYGRFPDATTIPEVMKSGSKIPFTLGTNSSNQLFRQLLVGGGGKSEKPFWAKTAIAPKKSDDIFTNDATAIAPGECGFAYIAGLKSSDDPETPIAMTSLLPGKLTFDPKAHDGKAVILRLDNSVTSSPIGKDGRVMINGMDLFDPRQPFWHGKAPDVKWPQ